MTARPVLLTADEHAEVERLDFEAESPTARRQYLAELVVLRGLVTAARAVVEAWETSNEPDFLENMCRAIIGIREALESAQKSQDEQGHSLEGSSPSTSAADPIGEVKENGVVWFDQNPHAYPVGTRFYTQPLTAASEEEVYSAWWQSNYNHDAQANFFMGWRAAEAHFKIGEKK